MDRVAIYNLNVPIATLYKIEDRKFFISISTPSISLQDHRMSPEYVSILANDKYTIEVDTEGSLFFPIDSYINDPRIFAHDWKSLRSLRKNMDNFREEVKRIRREDTVVALVYLWFNFFVMELQPPFTVSSLLGTHELEHYQPHIDKLEDYLNVFVNMIQ